MAKSCQPGQHEWIVDVDDGEVYISNCKICNLPPDDVSPIQEPSSEFEVVVECNVTHKTTGKKLATWKKIVPYSITTPDDYVLSLNEVLEDWNEDTKSIEQALDITNQPIIIEGEK